MAFIFAASSVPGTQLPGRLWDKLVHFTVYAVLGILFLLPLTRGRLSGVTIRSATGALVLAVLYGISDELHQRLTPHRTSDPMDVVADALGAAGGILLVVALRAMVSSGRKLGPPDVR
jgi:VanZ family protein